MIRFSLILLAIFLITTPVLFASTTLTREVSAATTTVVLYRNANLSLIEEDQRLSLQKGFNQLHFAWAGTSIDPTSLMLLPKGGDAEVVGLSFPPQSRGQALWDIESKREGESHFTLSYFTIGLTAETSYRLTLNAQGDRAQLTGFLHLQNRSREDFEQLKFSLLVGSVRVIDDVFGLANRSEPYGRPANTDRIAAKIPRSPMPEKKGMMLARVAMADSFAEEEMVLDQTQTVSDYAFIPLPGLRTLKAGWGEESRLVSAPSVDVINRFRYDEDRYGRSTIHLLNLVNDSKHGLGRGPLPDGSYQIYQQDENIGIFYRSEAEHGFVPIGGVLQLNLGNSDLVEAVVTDMNRQTFDHQFDQRRAIGWREKSEYQITIVNRQQVPATIEITRRMNGANWVVEHDGEYGSFKQLDQNRGQYLLQLYAGEKREFGYTVTADMGSLEVKK